MYFGIINNNIAPEKVKFGCQIYQSILCCVLYETGTDYPSRAPEFTPAFLVGSVFLCCPIMCLYVLSFVLWCPLRFPHKTMSLLPVVCRRAHILFTLFSYSGVQYILCCVFILFFFVFCTLCYQFHWIFHFWLPIRYSPPLILCQNLSPTYFPKYWIRVQMYFPMGVQKSFWPMMF